MATTKKKPFVDAGACRRFAEVVAQLRRAPLTSRDQIAVARDLRVRWHTFSATQQKQIAAQWSRVAGRGGRGSHVRDRYVKIVTELYRVRVNGSLSMTEESHVAAVLEEVWHKLSAGERHEIEELVENYKRITQRGSGRADVGRARHWLCRLWEGA